MQVAAKGEAMYFLTSLESAVYFMRNFERNMREGHPDHKDVKVEKKQRRSLNAPCTFFACLFVVADLKICGMIASKNLG